MTKTQLRFGTDGLRGPFGDPPLDRSTVTVFGLELGRMLVEEDRSRRVVVGGDTRESTPLLASWLAAGIAAAECELLFLGTVPTPAVAWAARALGCDGVAVSASHNPWQDNGLKLVGDDGFKWSREREARFERRLEERLRATPSVASEVHPSPTLTADQEWVSSYLSSLGTSIDTPERLAGLRLAVDCANGAASPWAAELLTSLGADVTAMADAPDGRNINLDCGSTHPDALQSLVAEGSYDLGVAFDGDADRALFVAPSGELVDGDAVLYLWARALAASGDLDPKEIVATSMSNLGLEKALRAAGIGVVRCDVGDRVVVETLRERGLTLGGEQSGHIVHLGLGTTGDGLLTAIQVATRVAASPGGLDALLEGFETFPQILKNLEVVSKPPLDSLPAVVDAVDRARRALGDDGRIVLRYSGTEPLARVMIEGPEQTMIEELADEILAAIDRSIPTAGAEGAA